MPKTRVEVESNPPSAACAPSQNAADAVIEIARDTLHGHLNTVARLSEVFVPTSMGTILRHEVPPYGRLNWDFLGLGIGQCGFWNALNQNLRVSSGTVRVADDGEAYILDYAVPGCDSTDLDVLVASRTVRVQSKKVEPGKTTNTVYGTWMAPEALIAEGATATLDKGILRVTVLKREENRAHRVEIST